MNLTTFFHIIQVSGEAVGLHFLQTRSRPEHELFKSIDSIFQKIFQKFVSDFYGISKKHKLKFYGYWLPESILMIEIKKINIYKKIVVFKSYDSLEDLKLSHD